MQRSRDRGKGPGVPLDRTPLSTSSAPSPRNLRAPAVPITVGYQHHGERLLFFQLIRTQSANQSPTAPDSGQTSPFRSNDRRPGRPRCADRLMAHRRGNPQQLELVARRFRSAIRQPREGVMTLQNSRRGKERLRTARALLRSIKAMTDRVIAAQLKALADDHERRAKALLDGASDSSRIDLSIRRDTFRLRSRSTTRR